MWSKLVFLVTFLAVWLDTGEGWAEFIRHTIQGKPHIVDAFWVVVLVIVTVHAWKATKGHRK